MGTYTGTAANDTITPDLVSAGVTRIPGGTYPSAAADTIDGLGGNDILDGGGGGDTINGGDGDDFIHDRPVLDYETMPSANDGNTIHGDGGDDRIIIDFLDTGGANPVGNVAYGDDGDDTLTVTVVGSYDDDRSGSAPTGWVALYGGAGADALSLQTYYMGPAPGMAVYQSGGAGNDKLTATSDEYDPDGSVTGSNNADYLYGGSGDDQYTVFETKDVVSEVAGEGFDKIFAFETDYTLPANVEALEMKVGYSPYGPYRAIGNALDNIITTDNGIYGGPTDYVMDGAGGNDVIYGSPGSNDTIAGGTGNDTLYGKANDGFDDSYPDDDTIHGGFGDDLIYGSGGDKDTWDGDDLLYGDDGNDRIFGSFGDDHMYGGYGNDELGGQAGNDTMYGDDGNDKLGGGSGNDWLYGGDGVDILSGRAGLDRLYGEDGNDIFDYDAVTDSKGALRDVIGDFVGVGKTVGDRIDLSTIDANTTVGGNQAFKFVGTAKFTAPGQVRVVASGADTLVQANTDANKATVELDILVKDGTALHTQWVAGDFIL